jgi:hypothetical protein
MVHVDRMRASSFRIPVIDCVHLMHFH